MLTEGEMELVLSGVTAIARQMDHYGSRTLADVLRQSPDARRIAEDILAITEPARLRPLRSAPSGGILEPVS